MSTGWSPVVSKVSRSPFAALCALAVVGVESTRGPGSPSAPQESRRRVANVAPLVPHERPHGPPRVLYIGGSGRSGSTLLARRLGAIEGAAAVGELRYVLERGVMHNHLCGCGTPFRACPFWAEVMARVLGGMDEAAAGAAQDAARAVDRIRHVPALLHPRLRRGVTADALAGHGQFISRLYRAVADRSGARVIVDSSKDPSYACLLHATGAVELYVLHLVRDPRAVAHSWQRARVRPEIHWKVEYMTTRTPWRASAMWLTANLPFGPLGRRVPTRTVRYEDFVADPDGTIDAIARWVGLESTTSAAAPFRHDISGNPMRFSAAPAEIREDAAWRTEMTPAHRRLVGVLTGAFRRRYGYRR